MSNSPSSSQPGIRWWPALIIVALATFRFASIWLGEAEQLQDRVVPTVFTAGLTGIALFLWLFLASRLPWRTRGKLALGVVAAGFLFGALVRFEGFSGDLIPDLSWRWSGGGELASAAGSADAPTTLSPTDFHQFLGPGRDAVIEGPELGRDWDATPPRELWRRPVGAAWSSFAVVGSAAVTQEQRGPEEAVVRYDLTSGEPVWSTTYPGNFETVIGGSGPRATPTIHDGRIYAYGSTGTLVALSLADGSTLWQRDTAGQRPGNESGKSIPTMPEWGYAGSPLIVDDLVIVAPGGADGNSVVAFDRLNGEPVWNAGDDPAAYASPMIAELLGQTQVVVRHIGSVTGHDPVDGRILWSAEWPGFQPNVAQPVVFGDDRLLVSSGYGIGSVLFQLSRDEAGTIAVSKVWESLRLKAKFSNPVPFGDLLYGLDDGVMTAIDPATGGRVWKRGRYGHGQVLRIGDLILAQTEKGDLILVEPNPEELRELGKIKILDGKSWNTFAVSGPYLLVRNADEAACYELPVVS